jgi:hypothetical protein
VISHLRDGGEGAPVLNHDLDILLTDGELRELQEIGIGHRVVHLAATGVRLAASLDYLHDLVENLLLERVEVQQFLILLSSVNLDDELVMHHVSTLWLANKEPDGSQHVGGWELHLVKVM